MRHPHQNKPFFYRYLTHKSPSVNTEGICPTKIPQTLKKILPIFAVAKYLYSINAPAHHVM